MFWEFVVEVVVVVAVVAEAIGGGSFKTFSPSLANGDVYGDTGIESVAAVVTKRKGGVKFTETSEVVVSLFLGAALQYGHRVADAWMVSSQFQHFFLVSVVGI